MVITFQFLQIHSPWCNLVLLMCTNEYGLFTVLSQWVLFVTSGVDRCFAGGWLVVPYANQRCWYTLYNWCICVRGCVCGGIGGMHHSIFHQHNHHQHLLIRLPHIMLLGEHDVSNEFTVSDSGQIFRVIRYLVMLLLFSFSSDLLSVFFFCIANSLWINHDPFSFIIYAIPQTEKLYPLRWWRHQQQWINEDGGGIIIGVKTIARKWWRKEKKKWRENKLTGCTKWVCTEILAGLPASAGYIQVISTHPPLVMHDIAGERAHFRFFKRTMF